MSVSTFADDVSLFLRSPTSLLAVKNIFAGYFALSGGQLNRWKSQALRAPVDSSRPTASGEPNNS